jgi:iron complex outermembrane recepter protein
MKTSRTLVAVAVATVFGTQPLQAETAGAEQDTLGVEFLEEIKVVARKQVESAQDVPLAISAVTAEQIEATGVRDVNDLTAIVPSLVVTTNSNPFTTSYRIRRIGNEGNIPDFEPDSGLFIDGAYRSRSGTGIGDLADIEQIELLRGPQSTLYGRTVTAGAIGVRTALPTQDFGAKAELSAGNDSLYGVRGFVTGGLTDSLAGRLSVTGTQRDTADTNLTGADSNDLGQYSVRGQLLFTPSDAWQIRLITSGTQRDFTPPLADIFYGPAVMALVNTVAMNPAALGAADGPGLTDGIINAGAQPILDNDPTNRRVQALSPLTFEQKAYDGIASIEYSGDKYTLTSITSYDSYDIVQRWQDAGQTGLDLVNYRDTQKGDTLSQELRINSDVGDLRWLAGLFYYNNHFVRGDKDKREFVLGQAIDELGLATGLASATLPDAPIFGLPGDTGDFFEISNTQNYGIFGQSSWDATDRLALTLGLRYTYEDKDVSLANSSFTTAPGTLAALSLPARSLTPAAASFSQDNNWDAATGTVNAVYRVNELSMVYGTVATGFKAGGFNGGFGNTPLAKRPFKSEEVISYELGSKAQFGNRIRLNTAAFLTDYDDFQSASFIGLQFLVNNAEKVRVKGLEADLTAVLTNDIAADVSATYAHAKYEKYTQGSCFTGRTPDDPVTGGCDLSGATLPFAPKLTATLGVQWEHKFDFGRLSSRIDGSFAGNQNVTSELDPIRGKQERYALLNARLGFARENWELSAWVRNLTDKTYVVQTAQSNIFSALQDGTNQTYLGAERTFGVMIQAKY